MLSTPAKAEPLRALGALLVQSPKEVAMQSDVVFTIVGYPKDVEAVLLGKDGVVQSMKAGGIIVDMTTSQPSLAQEIAKHAAQRGISTLDCPVSGGDIGAKNGTLSIMIGGDAKTVESVTPLLRTFGKTITHLGGPGMGQHTKMVNQILISTTMIGVVEGLLYGYKAGLNLETVIQAVGGGAAGSWSINNYGPRILRRDFQPGFFIEHFVKDLGIALEEAKRMDLQLPGLVMAHGFYEKMVNQGRGRLGTQALQLVFEEMNGDIEVKGSSSANSSGK